MTFDFRGLGETRMPYKALSEDDPSFAQLDFDRAYVNPLSSVLAGYVYNSLLTGRPYFLQMIEDFEIASRFSQSVLQQKDFSVVSDEEGSLFTSAVICNLSSRQEYSATGYSSVDVVRSGHRWARAVADPVSIAECCIPAVKCGVWTSRDGPQAGRCRMRTDLTASDLSSSRNSRT